MLIRELSKRTGVPAKTIRFYEETGLIKPPQRSENNYRQYDDADVEQLMFVKAIRRLGFGVNDIAQFMETRERGEIPCQHILDLLDDRITDLDRQIAELLALRELVVTIRKGGGSTITGQDLCACYLPAQDGGQIIVQKEAKRNVRVK